MRPLHLPCTFSLLFVFLLSICPSPWADELDSLLSGFEEEKVAEGENELKGLLDGFTEPEAQQQKELSKNAPLLPNWLTLQGSLSLQTTINFSHDAPKTGEPDFRGLSKFRGHGELIAEASFSTWKVRMGGTAFYDAAYMLNDQEDLFTQEYLDEYENGLELNEAFIKGGLTNNVDLKIGRQIVVWGKSDNLRVTDILNPLDLRYPGMLDIRYLRLPVTMSRLDYFWNSWNISTMLIHEPRFNRLTGYNGDFFPGTQPLPRLETPDWSLDNQQAGVALNGIFSGWDLSFYAASVFQEKAYIKFDPLSTPFRTYERTTMLGAAVNMVFGSWLIKAEVAYWDGLKYSNISDEKPRVDLLAGFEYMGFSDTVISLEIANRHIIDYDPLLANSPDSQRKDWDQYALRFTRDFLNDTLHLTAIFSSYGLFAEDGGFERFQLDYDLNDFIVLKGGVVFYESGDFPGFKNIDNNDRLMLELEYRF